MSTATMILGESGTGKSTSLRNLNPARTLLIQAVKKPLPFKSKGWLPYSKLDGSGSIIQSDNPAYIDKAMRAVKREIVVLDDFQYILANEFMRRSHERGFDKFTDIGRNAWELLMTAASLADDRRVYILCHTASDDAGRVRMKTIGKLLDDKITPEGLVTIVLRTIVRDGQFLFRTQNDGSDTTKSPMGLFDSEVIDNDLAAVDDAICDYYGIGVTA